MKKFIALVLTIVTLMSSVSTTVSAASVEKSLKIGFSFLEEFFEHFSDVIDILKEVAEIASNIDLPEKEEPPKDDIQEETPEIIVPPVSTSLEVRAGIYDYESTYVVYGEVVPCHWIHTNNSATMVEILSDVQSEEFLTTEDVEELFLEKFGRRALVYESERQVKTFLMREVYSGKEYLIPVKDEGLPVEVWEAFASEFEADFTCEFTLLDEEGIKYFFEERLGYAPKLAVWYRGENDVLIDIEFAHLGGKFYIIEAVYSEDLEEWCLTKEALEKFCERNLECATSLDLTWEQHD